MPELYDRQMAEGGAREEYQVKHRELIFHSSVNNTTFSLTNKL